MATQTPDKMKKISQRENSFSLSGGPRLLFTLEPHSLFFFFLYKTWVGGFRLMSESPRPFSLSRAPH